MVQIGGDRATNADYRRANKEAVRRSQSKPKAESKKEIGQRVLGTSRTRANVPKTRWQPKPKTYTPPPNQQAPAAPFRLGQPGSKPVADPGGYQQFKAAQQVRDAGQPREASGDRLGQLQLLDQAATAKKENRPNVAPADQNLTSQPGVAPNVPNPPVPHAAIPPVSDGVREMLNARNWKLPSQGKKAEMPKSSFEKGGVTDLEEHDYTVSEDEWERIKATYSSPEARAAGYIPPPKDAASIDKNMPLLELDNQESVALTWDAYEKLNDGQRAAVDFNTLLVDAREKDLDKQVKLTGIDKAKYDTKVLNMFGEGHGSDTVATNTIKLLSEFDMVQVGQDLDEYLSLERGIDTTELPDFEFSKGDLKTLDALTNGTTATPEQYAGVRTEANMNILDTQNVQGAEAAIKAAMAQKSPDTYSFETLMYGSKARPKETESQIGYGLKDTKWASPEDAAMNEWFQGAMTMLSAQDLSEYGVPAGADPMADLLAALPSTPGYNSKTKQQFLNYVQNRTDMLGQYGSPEEATTAALVAKRAGLGG